MTTSALRELWTVEVREALQSYRLAVAVGTVATPGPEAEAGWVADWMLGSCFEQFGTEPAA